MMTSKKIKITGFDSSKYLKNEESIAEYLKASWEMNDPEVFLAALSVAAKARGMTQLAKKAGVCRESLYKSLSPGGNPSFKTIFKIAIALGMSFDAMPDGVTKAANA
jgi:probable addiction module antidote protein